MPTKRHVGQIGCAVGSWAILNERASERLPGWGSMGMALSSRHRPIRTNSTSARWTGDTLRARTRNRRKRKWDTAWRSSLFVSRGP